MIIRATLSALSIAGAIAGTADAETLKPKPIEGGTVVIGVVRGSGYYTVEPDGYHVVITLTKGIETPVRFEAVLADKQHVILSSPQEAGKEAETIEVKRDGEEIVVTKNLAKH